jgi:hypothetical protein
VKRLSLLAAAGWLAASAASAAAVLVPGTPVTGTLDGAASGLLGADRGYEAVAGSNITAVLDGFDSIEFIAADYSFALDLGSDGLLRLWGNTDSGFLAGTHVQLALAPVPEPAPAALLALGLIALTLRRSIQR